MANSKRNVLSSVYFIFFLLSCTAKSREYMYKQYFFLVAFVNKSFGCPSRRQRAFALSNTFLLRKSLEMLLLIAVLALALPTCTAQSVQVAISTTPGESLTTTFTATRLDLAALHHEVQQFCRSIDGQDGCVDSIHSEISSWRMQAGIWNHPQLVGQHFTADLVATECQQWSVRGYANESDCIAKADGAIRSVKVAGAFPLADQLVRMVNDNNLVPLSADWKSDIEGNTIGFIRKVQFLHALADDSRVERICEVGFNLGHSVGHVLLTAQSLVCLAVCTSCVVTVRFCLSLSEVMCCSPNVCFCIDPELAAGEPRRLRAGLRRHPQALHLCGHQRCEHSLPQPHRQPGHGGLHVIYTKLYSYDEHTGG